MEIVSNDSSLEKTFEATQFLPSQKMKMFLNNSVLGRKKVYFHKTEMNNSPMARKTSQISLDTSKLVVGESGVGFPKILN